MPRDLFAEQGVTQADPTATAGGPRDLFAGQTNPSQPLWGRLASDIDIGGAQMGAGVRSAPHYIAQALAAHGAISPQTAARFPRPDVLTPQQRGQFWGVPKPNIGDVLLQKAAQYAPYGIGGGASLAGQTAAGGAYGATQTPRPLMGAAIGAATNLGLGKAAQLAARGIPPLTKILSKYAAPGLVKTIKGSLDDFKDLKNATAFEKAKGNFDDYQSSENAAWDNLNKQATLTDMNPSVKFQPESYKTALGSRLNQLQKEGEQSGLARKNADSIALLKDYQNDPTQSFTQAIQHNRALNADFQNEITPGKSLPFSTVNYAKQNLRQTIENNLKNNKLEGNLGLSWQQANQTTANKNSIFNEIVSPAGKPQPSTFMKYYRGDPEHGDPTNFIDQYVPKAKGEGIQKMQQFSKMVGDDNYAKNVLKMNYFGKTYNEDGFKPGTFLNKYNDLSSDQKNYLFTTEQKNTIDTLNKIIAKHPGAIQRTTMGGFGWYHSVPGLAGFAVGGAMGRPFEGAMGGVLGTRLAELGLQQWGKRAAPQARVISALTGGKLPTRTPGMLGNLLASRFGAAAITPQTTKLAGGQ